MKKISSSNFLVNHFKIVISIGIFFIIIIVINMNSSVYADSASLRINEFTTEWVELKNFADVSIDPTHYEFGCTNYDQSSGDGGPILDNSGNPLALEIPSQGIIWMPIEDICGGDLTQYYPNGILSVRDTEEFGLSDSVIYGDGELAQVPLPQVGQSGSLLNGSWQLTGRPTKGLDNVSDYFSMSTATIFRSGQGNWEVPSSKFVTNGDYDGDGYGEIAVMYDYGNEDMAIIIFKTVGNQVETRTIFRSGTGNWDISRTKYLISEDYDNDGKSEIAAMYDYGGGDMALIVFQ